MNPEISLIMPVFNGEQTLRRALESVRSQTFSDFECLIIDDGSTDGTADLLQTYAVQDSRFRFLSIPNSGVSHAKNRGLEQARGRFWAFLDCDDFLEHNALEILHQLATETNANAAIGHIVFEDAKGQPAPQSPALPKLTEIPWRMPASQAAAMMFQGKPFGGHLHGKLLRAGAMDSLRYREDISIFEDMLFLLEAFSRGGEAAYTPTVVHHYLAADSGAMAAPLNPRKASSLLACEEMKAVCKQFFPACVSGAEQFAAKNALWVLEELAASPTAIRRQPWAVSARQKACRVIRSHGMPEGLPAMSRLFYQAARLGWPAFLLLYNGPYKAAKKMLK